jgi:hypothetical protein
MEHKKLSIRRRRIKAPPTRPWTAPPHRHRAQPTSTTPTPRRYAPARPSLLSHDRPARACSEENDAQVVLIMGLHGREATLPHVAWPTRAPSPSLFSLFFFPFFSHRHLEIPLGRPTSQICAAQAFPPNLKFKFRLKICAKTRGIKMRISRVLFTQIQ